MHVSGLIVSVPRKHYSQLHVLEFVGSHLSRCSGQLRFFRLISAMCAIVEPDETATIEVLDLTSSSRSYCNFTIESYATTLLNRFVWPIDRQSDPKLRFRFIIERTRLHFYLNRQAILNLPFSIVWCGSCAESRLRIREGNKRSFILKIERTPIKSTGTVTTDLPIAGDPPDLSASS
jgi:hypothetical protein